jgi:hypothetical protein
VGFTPALCVSPFQVKPSGSEVDRFVDRLLTENPISLIDIGCSAYLLLSE